MSDLQRIWDGMISSYVGTYMMYGLDKDGVTWLLCDVTIEPDFHHLKMLRAYRLWRKAQGKSIPKMKEDRLAKEAIIIWGPDVSPIKAIGFLENAIADIKKNGLPIGKIEGGDDYFRESLNGEIFNEDGIEIPLSAYEVS